MKSRAVWVDVYRSMCDLMLACQDARCRQSSAVVVVESIPGTLWQMPFFQVRIAKRELSSVGGNYVLFGGQDTFCGRPSMPRRGAV